MKFWPLFFLLFSQAISAQEVLFEGFVYDQETKEPIPFVNISFIGTLKGTSSDESGHFYIDIPQQYLEKEVHISSLGYQEVVLKAETVYNTKRIHLTEESYELEEVVVSHELGDGYVLNPISSNNLKSGFASSSTPWVMALYFPNIGQQEKYLEKVNLFFQNNKDYTRPFSKFRLRLFSVDPETKKPDKDLIRKSLVLTSYQNDDFVSIDLSAFALKVPREGIYVGVEWLFIPSNWYKKAQTEGVGLRVKIEDRFAPVFGGVYSKNPNFKTMVYGLGEWTPFITKSIDGKQNLIPAISVKFNKALEK